MAAHTYTKALYRIGPKTLVPLVRGRVETFTDPMSNAVSLGHSDILARLNAAVPGALALSDPYMRFFLHEVTHHATFAGKVGRAQSALATSVAARAAVGSPPEGGGGLWLPQRDDLVLRFFDTIIEPLVEGIALFAEHDVRWGPFDYTSHPLLHLWSLFLIDEAGDAAQRALAQGGDTPLARARSAYAEAVNTRLRRGRTSDYWIEQKARLLSQPVLGAGGGPAYLLGYLATKRAYLVLRDLNPAVTDSDIFVLLMLDYWFGDETTGCQLVAFDDADVMRVQTTIGALVERFQDLWQDLYRAPSAALRRMAQNLASQMPAHNALALGPLELGLGVRVAPEAVNVFVPGFQKHRLVLRLGVIRVDLTCDAETRTAVVRETETGDTLFKCPTVPLADQGNFPGSVEVVRTYDGSLTAVVVIGPSGLMAVRDLFSSTWNPPELVDHFDDLPSIEHAEAAARSYTESPFIKTWEDGDLATMNKNLMEQAAAVRNGVYLQIAFPGAREHQRDQAMDRLGRGGFTSLFETKKELDDVTRLSLHFGGPGTPIDEVAGRLERPPREVESLLRSINAKSQTALGVDVFEIHEERTTSAI